MRDAGNQIVLGIFIGTFTFCLCILRVVGGPTGDFIPRISVTTAFLLTAISIGALVYFIHHAASLIQAQAIIATIARELDSALEPLYPADVGESGAGRDEGPLPADLETRSVAVVSARSDYVQAIDGPGLMALAQKRDLIISLAHRPGDFAVCGEVIARAYPAQNVAPETSDAIQAAFIFGDQRTQAQDPEFVLSELVEIAVRALSPGINDPATAMLCIDRLAAALGKVASRPLPSSRRYNSEGRLRIIAKHYGFRGLVRAAVNPIRQYGRRDVAVTIRLLEGLSRVALHASRAEDCEALLEQARIIERASHESDFAESDRADIAERFRAIEAELVQA
jgi:uncharacterized membrane protein